jgi:hypothetical protein
MKPIKRIIFIKMPLSILVAAALNACGILMIHLVGLVFSWSFISFLLTHWWALVLWFLIVGTIMTVLSIGYVGVVLDKKE